MSSHNYPAYAYLLSLDTYAITNSPALSNKLSEILELGLLNDTSPYQAYEEGDPRKQFIDIFKIEHNLNVNFFIIPEDADGFSHTEPETLRPGQVCLMFNEDELFETKPTQAMYTLQQKNTEPVYSSWCIYG